MAIQTRFASLNKSHDLKAPAILLACFLSIILAWISKDSILFLAGSVSFIFFLYIFFNKNLPPVILFSFFFQWLFLQGQLLDGLLKGESIVTLDYSSVTKIDVTVYGLIGTCLFFFGMYLAVRNVPILSLSGFNSFFYSLRLSRILRLYCFTYIVLFLAGKFVWYFPGLSQPLYTLTYFRWSLFFLLFCGVFVQDKFKGLLLLLITIDIAISFFSFFSHFKEVIYFSFLAYWIFFFRSSYIAKLLTIVIIGFTVYLGTLWSAVKSDYRNFLNQGTGKQTVFASREDAYIKLLQLTGNVKDRDISRGFDDLVDRLSIVGVFDAVYKKVPAKIPHEEGALWLEGITRPFLPRLLFPGKKVLEDSKELNKYSSLDIDEKNTSVSLSMMAGSYVDFGRWGMHIPLFLFGIFCGWVYMKAIKWGNHPVIGYALTMPMIYLLHINEESINRIVSSMILYLLVLWFLKTVLLSKFINFILKPTIQPSRRFQSIEL